MHHRRTLIFVVLLAFLLSACVSPVSIPFLATQTPEPTSTSTPTPTPTPTPTATPTPTPLPAARLSLGEDAIFLGNYELARKQYQDVLAQTSESEARSAAAIGIGRALFLERNYPAAIKQLNSAIQEYPDSPDLAEAWFFLAEAYNIQLMYADAASAYAKYLELKPGVIDGYIQEWRGDALVNAEDYVNAAGAYEAALANPMPGDPVWLRISLAKAYAAAQDYTKAVTLFPGHIREQHQRFCARPG